MTTQDNKLGGVKLIIKILNFPISDFEMLLSHSVKIYDVCKMAKNVRKMQLFTEHTVCYHQGSPLFWLIKALAGLWDTNILTQSLALAFVLWRIKVLPDSLILWRNLTSRISGNIRGQKCTESMKDPHTRLRRRISSWSYCTGLWDTRTFYDKSYFI